VELILIIICYNVNVKYISNIRLRRGILNPQKQQKTRNIFTGRRNIGTIFGNRMKDKFEQMEKYYTEENWLNIKQAIKGAAK
jgi:hypothetical protein